MLRLTRIAVAAGARMLPPSSTTGRRSSCVIDGPKQGSPETELFFDILPAQGERSTSCDGPAYVDGGPSGKIAITRAATSSGRTGYIYGSGIYSYPHDGLAVARPGSRAIVPGVRPHQTPRSRASSPTTSSTILGKTPNWMNAGLAPPRGRLFRRGPSLDLRPRVVSVEADIGWRPPDLWRSGHMDAASPRPRSAA